VGDRVASVGSVDLAGFIRSHRDEILAAWEEDVRRHPTAWRLSHAALLDHIPPLLDRIVELAQAPAPGSVGDLADEHALHRLDDGFDLTEVLAELFALRRCILRAAAHNGLSLSIDDQLILDEAIDRAIADSALRFSRALGRTLQALDRISTEALRSRGLDELLSRLLKVLVETTEAVDTAVIFLRDGELLHARASIGMEEEVARGFTLEVGEGFVGGIAADGRVRALRSAATDPSVMSNALRSRGIRALHGVPLLEGDDVVGVAYMGSRTAYEFSQQDRRLFQALASRATSAIVQHSLWDMAARRARMQSAVAELGMLALRADEPAGVLGEAARAACAAVNAERATILETRPGGKALIRAAVGWPEAKPNETEVSLGATPGVSIPVSSPGPWGQLIIQRTRNLGPDERDFLRAVANIVGTVIARHRSEMLLREAEERTARERGRLEQVLRRMAFLADASTSLSTSLDYRHTLRRLAETLVDAMADVCVIDVIQADGTLGRQEVAAGDAGTLQLARRMQAFAPRDEGPIGDALRSGHSSLVAEVTPSWRDGLATTEEHRRVLQQLDPHSMLFVPLRVRERPLGIITIASLDPDRRYDERDQAFAEELARRAAYAVDNARLYQEAQEAIRTREDVLAIVSHDLKNPLGAILLSTSVTLRNPVDEERVRKQALTIQRAAQRMNHLIHDLLDMTAIEAGQLVLDRAVVTVDELVSEAVSALQAIAGERGVKIVGQAAPGLRAIVDRERVLQVLSNLIGNAIRFSPKEGTVTVRAEPCDEGVCLSVDDRGPGIPADSIPHLFERFWKGKRESRQGSGLGLFIAKGIVAAHGGRLWVETEEGKGATFRFTLPAPAV
jgi:signal transduction histidine kinase